jgi:hypothetical protein
MDLIKGNQACIVRAEVAKNNNSHTVAPGDFRAGAQAMPKLKYSNGRSRLKMSEDMRRYWKRKDKL